MMGKMVMYEGKPLKVKPFRLMTGLELPTKKLATELDTKWKPIFCKMMEAPGVWPLPDHRSRGEFLERYFLGRGNLYGRSAGC